MRGQWVGDYNAQYPGRVTVNVDVVGKGFRAVAYLRPSERTMPKMVVRFGTDHQLHSFVVRTENFHLLHPETGQPVEWEKIKERYGPDMQMSKSIQVHCAWDANSFTARWGTDVGSIGQFELPRSKASDASELVPKVTSWQQYRAYIDSLRGRKLIFRGQSKPWRLRTAFHRHGRADLERFALEDIPQLHKYLTSRTRHVFNLSNVLEIGAFMALAQHHGYRANSVRTEYWRLFRQTAALQIALSIVMGFSVSWIRYAFQGGLDNQRGIDLHPFTVGDVGYVVIAALVPVLMLLTWMDVRGSAFSRDRGPIGYVYFVIACGLLFLLAQFVLDMILWAESGDLKQSFWHHFFFGASLGFFLLLALLAGSGRSRS